MKKIKKFAASIVLLSLVLSLAGCGAAPALPAESPAVNVEEGSAAGQTPLSVAALKGPTAMGLVKLMSEERAEYSFALAASADEITPLLIKGELDSACLPANLASVLYNKTGGGIVTLGINTLGVIYVVEKGEEIRSLADLKGRTLVAAGKGSTPEYAFRYLLTENGLDPDTDVSVEWKSEHSECVAALAAGEAEAALLPQPFVTVAASKIEGLRSALDLTEEWDKLDNGSALITGVVVARKAAVEKDPAAIEAFLADYAESVAWVNANTSDAAALIGGYDIVAAPVAEKALPYCNIVCITGSEMKAALSGYLAVLAGQAPQSVGGAVPGDDFYYGA